MRVGRYQMKIAFSYMLIILVILVLLNTYPILISQNSLFQSKKSALEEQASLAAWTLASMDTLQPEETGRVIKEFKTLSSYRVIVCNERGLVVYDNSTVDSTAGKFALQGEIVTALSGRDVYRGKADVIAFESFVAIPVMTRGRVIGAVYLYEYDPEQAALLKSLQNDLSTFSVLITVVVVILSIFISLALTRRVSGLMQAIRAVGVGEYDVKAPVKGSDELAQVAGQFNELTERLAKTETLRQQFVSDASHELKTPLSAIRLLADSVLQNEDMDEETIKDFMSDIGQEIDRLARTTEKLMLLTRLDSASPPPEYVLYPAPVIRRAAHMLTPLAENAGVSLRCELDERCSVMGNYDDLYTVVFNLIENAIKYNHPGGAVRVLCFAREVYSQIIVDDTGVGIPDEDVPRVFDRFYRVDKARSREAGGTGLGLSIVAETVRRMGGSIELDSILGKGTRFTVSFPVVTRDEQI